MLHAINNMITASLLIRLTATPHQAMENLLSGSRQFGAERAAQNLKAYDPGFPVEPGFPRDDPPPEPPKTPVKPIPTDVPAPEPRDVPAPEPHDVPPPDVGKPAQQNAPDRPVKDPRPRPVP